ncbi:MAG: endonuclease MutS2 [Flavobacteriales bacterium]
MIQPDDQTIRDLGFDLIREWLKGYSVQPTARERFSSLALHSSTQALRSSMELLSEWLMIRRSGAAFPAIDFEELTAEIAMLEVKDGVLSEVSFERIWRASALVNELVKALTEIEEGFPRLRELMKEVHYTEELITAITGVFDAKWNVKDSASPELAAIRLQIGDVRRQISKNFQKAMKDYASKGFLGDTGEAFINERRVLAVYSTHKRKISGIVVGSSNTGALTYIEPEVNIQLNFELEALHDDERNEVRKILRKLTRDIRTQAPLIDAYQTLLTELDFLQAKTRLAMELDASIPLISEEQVIRMKKAYHPILWMNNRKAGRVTFPQDIAMDKFSRMLIISGPNAGGKSITLKTIGLLQLMFQSGLALPVAEGAELGFFTSILTDIGDNQSIENQLSTYSYRLKRMNYFLQVANRRSLVLLDEFGTGSDPDLGGALAEVFFEEIYNRKSFGVITTHYGNIKLKAAQLRNAVNGCMLFNTETLEPMYRLSLGQPGSSFTFEVAEMNGIPMSLIDEARKRMSEQKVQMDKLLSSLQAEKTRFEKLSNQAREAGESASKTIADFEKKKDKYEEKLSRQTETIERNNKYLSHGRKMMQFIDGWNLRAKNKELLEDVKKYIVVEKTKIDEERKAKSMKKKAEKKKDEQVREIRHRELIKPGSLVRLTGTKQTGTVLELSGEEAVVAFGVFRTTTELNKLEFIR